MSDLTEIPEITPQRLSDNIEVVLMVTAADRDGTAFVMAFADGTGTMGSAESQARSAFSNASHEFARHGALVRVKVPRALLVERWKKADQ